MSVGEVSRGDGRSRRADFPVAAPAHRSQTPALPNISKGPETFWLRRANLKVDQQERLSLKVEPMPDAMAVQQSTTTFDTSGVAGGQLGSPVETGRRPRLSATFRDPDITANGERRAHVELKALETVWFNTGTLCNLTCENCYIESSPTNDRLVYLTREEVRRFLAEAAALEPPPAEIGFTGGEPFMNPEILGMIEDSLAAGCRALVLTNAMKPMQRLKAALCGLNERFPGRLTLRVSLDHYEAAGHERLRGPRSWQRTIDGLLWLASSRFNISVAGRTIWSETEASMRAGYGALFAKLNLTIDANDPSHLVLFPEMKADEDVPEITELCWGILGKRPDSVMCASSRMVIKRKGADRPTVVSCTLLPYDGAFELGASLAEAAQPVKLNHRYCARFCVLGGASCSPHGAR